MKPRIIGIAGWKNSGKTTLTERLVAELTRRGLRISTLKRAHHDVDVDHEGTDSHRHRQAGASEVLLVTGRRSALMHELHTEPEPSLEEMASRLSPCDLMIAEGWKSGTHPKIEVRRKDASDRSPLPASANVIAIASDHPVENASLPVFDLNAVADIADFILSTNRPSDDN